jgi:hypothetical protein
MSPPFRSAALPYRFTCLTLLTAPLSQQWSLPVTFLFTYPSQMSTLSISDPVLLSLLPGINDLSACFLLAFPALDPVLLPFHVTYLAQTVGFLTGPFS